jgi:hypothetical protein
MPLITPVELSAEETKAALMETGLWKHFANLERDQVVINCAHCPTHSFIIVRHQDGAYEGYKLAGGTTNQRRKRYDQIARALIKKLGGTRTKAADLLKVTSRN